jgi:hypothetical protein
MKLRNIEKIRGRLDKGEGKKSWEAIRVSRRLPVRIRLLLAGFVNSAGNRITTTGRAAIHSAIKP